MNYPMLLQASALGVLAIAAAQAVIWALQLRNFRSSISNRKIQAEHDFRLRLSRIRKKSAPQPVIPRAWNGEQVFYVATKTVLNADTCLVDLKPGSVAKVEPFLPGQHLFLSHNTPEQERILRCYSIVNSPLITDRYRLVVRRISAPDTPLDTPAGGMSSYVYDSLNEGDMIMVKAPAGHFYLRRDLEDQTPVLMIGIDIGILAILSMADTLRREQADRTLHVIYIARNEEDVIQCEELLRLQEHARNSKSELTIIFSETCEGLDSQVSEKLADESHRMHDKDFDAYIAGYCTAVADAQSALLEAGVPQYSIRTEVYKVRRNGERRQQDRRQLNSLASSLEAANDAEAHLPDTAAPIVQQRKIPHIVFSESQKTVNWLPAANSLLEFAEDQSIDIQSDCRMGSCHTCMTRLISGEVDYVQPPFNEPDTGFCLPCIAVPKSDVELEL